MLPRKSWHDHWKNFGKGTWQGSRDRDNSSVQTAAMGPILRSTERILVKIQFESRPVLMSKHHDALLFMVLYREAYWTDSVFVWTCILLAKKAGDYCYLPHPVHTGHTDFSDIEIESRSLGGVHATTASVIVFRLHHAHIQFRKPVNPHAVNLFEALRLAGVQSLGRCEYLRGLHRHPILELHERVSACSYTDHRPHIHIRINHHIDGSLALYHHIFVWQKVDRRVTLNNALTYASYYRTNGHATIRP